MSTENKNKTRRVRVGFFTGNGSKKDGTSAAKLAFEQMTTADTVTFPITYTTDTPNRGLKLVILQKDTTLPNTPNTCLLYTSPSPRDRTRSRMPSSA